MQLLRPWCIEELGEGLCVEVECAECVLLAKVEAEVAAPGVACLPIKEVEVAFIIEVSEAVLDVLIAEIMVVAWEVFCWRGWSERSGHVDFDRVGEVGALVKRIKRNNSFVRKLGVKRVAW